MSLNDNFVQAMSPSNIPENLLTAADAHVVVFPVRSALFALVCLSSINVVEQGAEAMCCVFSVNAEPFTSATTLQTASALARNVRL